MEDKAIDRAEFFKYIFGRGVAAASEAAENFVEPFQTLGNTAHKLLYQTLIPVSEYRNEPKLLTSSKPPIFIVGEVGKNLTAFPALCGTDGFLLIHLPQENALYCSACGTKHYIIYKDKQVECTLEAFPLTIKEGHICLINN